MPPFREWLQRRFPRMVWDKPHHLAIIEALERVTAGEIDRLMIFVPPRHGKSELVTIRYCAWRMERDPGLPVILGAYDQTLANKFSRKIRRIVRERVPLNDERTAVNEWETEAGGGLRAAGVGAGITGHGGGMLLIDDPVKGREEADSPAFRERLWGWYTDDFYTRREPGAPVILIQTRWHQDDLAGRILESEDGPDWTVVHIPALAMENDPLGREEGQALWPERVPAADIERYRSFNERGFWALYQGMPQPEGGAIMLRDWWDGRNRYEPRNPPATLFRVMSWDTAETLSEGSSFSACAVGDVVAWEGGYAVAIRDVWRGRVEFHELLDVITGRAERWFEGGILQEIWIEEASNGRAAISQLNAQAPGWMPRVQGYKTKGQSKDERARRAARSAYQGRVLLPEPHESVPWLAQFERELYDLPNSAFRDQADAFAQLILTPTVSGFILPDYGKAA